MKDSKKIKVLHLITGLNTGGAEVLVKNILKESDKKYFDMLAVSIIPLGSVGEAIKQEDETALSLDIKFKYNPILFYRLYKILKKERPDILHTHLFHSDIAGRFVGKMAKVPVIISTFHSIDMGGIMRVFFLKITKKMSHCNIAVSKIVKETMISLQLSSGEQTFVIYNSSRIDIIRLKKSIKKYITLLSVGRLYPEKGHLYLIDALSKISKKHPHLKLVILGEGPERRFLEKHIKKLSLEDNITLEGEVSDVTNYLQEADVFVVPSVCEGFSLALVEGAAANLPIIATDVGGNSEIITDGVNGFLVPPKDSVALAEKIDFVLNLSEEERGRVGDAARKTVDEKFSTKTMISEYEKLYQRLVDSLNN